jgi:hypothetical protein
VPTSATACPLQESQFFGAFATNITNRTTLKRLLWEVLVASVNASAPDVIAAFDDYRAYGSPEQNAISILVMCPLTEVRCIGLIPDVGASYSTEYFLVAFTLSIVQLQCGPTTRVDLLNKFLTTDAPIAFSSGLHDEATYAPLQLMPFTTQVVWFGPYDLAWASRTRTLTRPTAAATSTATVSRVSATSTTTTACTNVPTPRPTSSPTTGVAPSTTTTAPTPTTASPASKFMEFSVGVSVGGTSGGAGALEAVALAEGITLQLHLSRTTRLTASGGQAALQWACGTANITTAARATLMLFTDALQATLAGAAVDVGCNDRTLRVTWQWPAEMRAILSPAALQQTQSALAFPLLAGSPFEPASVVDVFAQTGAAANLALSPISRLAEPATAEGRAAARVGAASTLRRGGAAATDVSTSLAVWGQLFPALRYTTSSGAAQPLSANAVSQYGMVALLAESSVGAAENVTTLFAPPAATLSVTIASSAATTTSTASSRPILDNVLMTAALLALGITGSPVAALVAHVALLGLFMDRCGPSDNSGAIALAGRNAFPVVPMAYFFPGIGPTAAPHVSLPFDISASEPAVSAYYHYGAENAAAVATWSCVAVIALVVIGFIASHFATWAWAALHRLMLVLMPGAIYFATLAAGLGASDPQVQWAEFCANVTQWWWSGAAVSAPTLAWTGVGTGLPNSEQAQTPTDHLAGTMSSVAIVGAVAFAVFIGLYFYRVWLFTTWGGKRLFPVEAAHYAVDVSLVKLVAGESAGGVKRRAALIALDDAADVGAAATGATSQVVASVVRTLTRLAEKSTPAGSLAVFEFFTQNMDEDDSGMDGPTPPFMDAAQLASLQLWWLHRLSRLPRRLLPVGRWDLVSADSVSTAAALVAAAGAPRTEKVGTIHNSATEFSALIPWLWYLNGWSRRKRVIATLLLGCIMLPVPVLIALSSRNANQYTHPSLLLVNQPQPFAALLAGSYGRVLAVDVSADMCRATSGVFIGVGVLWALLLISNLRHYGGRVLALVCACYIIVAIFMGGTLTTSAADDGTVLAGDFDDVATAAGLRKALAGLLAASTRVAREQWNGYGIVSTLTHVLIVTLAVIHAAEVALDWYVWAPLARRIEAAAAAHANAPVNVERARPMQPVNYRFHAPVPAPVPAPSTAAALAFLLTTPEENNDLPAPESAPSPAAPAVAAAAAASPTPPARGEYQGPVNPLPPLAGDVELLFPVHAARARSAVPSRAGASARASQAPANYQSGLGDDDDDDLFGGLLSRDPHRPKYDNDDI